MYFNNSATALVVAAHPDDEVLGCGGTIKKLTDAGADVYVLILSEGKASRDEVELDLELSKLRKELDAANQILGVKEVFTAGFPDNAFDSVHLLEIVKKIEEIKAQIQPDIVLTHHAGDMNIDHQLTHRAVLTATRPMHNEVVKYVYAFEVPSSTEWNGFSKTTAFVPNSFVDISNTLDSKKLAMAEYKSELREYPHPRSLEYMSDLSKIWSSKIGMGEAVEAFVLIRQNLL